MIDCHSHIGIELLSYLRGEFPYCQHLVDLVVSGKREGIERFIVFPMISNLSMDLQHLRKGEIVLGGGLETVPYQFENRRLLYEIHELFPEEGKAAIPFVTVDPMRKVQAQAKALRELKDEYSFCGLKVQPTILQAPISHLREEGCIFLELLEEWNLPFMVHSSVLPQDDFSQAHAILDIVEATPNVRFCLAHSCRFDRTALDRIAALPNAWFDCSALCIHCELAVVNAPDIAPLERRFDSDYTNPARVFGDMAEAYPDSLLWGSDAPYYCYVANAMGQRYELRSTYAKEAHCLHSLPLANRHQIGHVNPLRLLGQKT